MDVLKHLSGELAKRSVALVVVDSMAMLARLEMTEDDIPKRQRLLAQQAGLLKRAAEAFNLTVVVTNQVTAGIGDGLGQRAALGVVWGHSVHTRLVLEQRNGVRCVRVCGNRMPGAWTAIRWSLCH
jgi:RecA/RadA recombinase